MTTVASAIAAYRRALALRGEVIEIRRGSAPNVQSVRVRARVKGFSGEDLVGDIQQGDRKVIILAEDVTLDPPLSEDDRLVVRGAPMQIETVDDSTRRMGETLIAYEVRARGF